MAPSHQTPAQTPLFEEMLNNGPPSPSSFEPASPAAEWAKEETRHALDELFNATFAYRESGELYELMQFVRRFHYYSPYNSMLIHIQRPGARFVAPPSRWKKKYNRQVRFNANPILILQPMGPVMFVFDISDTDPLPGEAVIPVDFANPFETRGGHIHGEYDLTIENAKRDSIRILEQKQGSQLAGSIRSMVSANLPMLKFQIGTDKYGDPVCIYIPTRYGMLLNSTHSREVRYSTMVHELAHLYCGHLGTPNKKWWPDRRGLDKAVVEFEAESVSYLVCLRSGIRTPSEEYLASFMQKEQNLPRISLECIMKAAGLIESMGRKRLKKRKGKNED